MKLKEAYQDKNAEYYKLSRPELHGFIKENQSALLDVGCGAGQLAYELKRNKNITEVWGVEPVKEFGILAEEKLDNVYVMSVEEVLPQLPNNKFDTIVFADVLEHLVDPESVLKDIKRSLKSTGEIFASIPNIRHWSIFIQLLEGNWDYTEHGLLDKTHLRFFTKKTIRKLFENSGYHPEFVGCQKVGNFQIPDNAMEMLSNSEFDISTLQEEINDFQYYVRAFLRKNAILLPAALLSQEMINKLQNLSFQIKSNLKILVLYRTTNPTVEFIKSLDEEKEGIAAVHIENLDLSKYGRFAIIDSSKFSIVEFEKHFIDADKLISGTGFVISTAESDNRVLLHDLTVKIK